MRTILSLLIVFILIRLFFPELGSTVQHVLELALGALERLLSSAAAQLP
ncbi:MAG: hypothetical protein HY340_00995 [Candidatus Kerfeldbacteria bacterium]|nr:hypothetical protein [Candidatus Kerfeldbacteria bacterium]